MRETFTVTGSPGVSFTDDIPSSFVLDREMRDALREPFPPEQIGQVNKGFGTVDFIGHAAITDRLNRAAPGWTYRVEPVVIQGKDGLPHVMAVFGTMTVGGVTRQEVGDVEHMTRYGDELKKAISDFICRGAMRFGVGLDLWSKEQLESPSRETPAESPSLSSAGEHSAPSRGKSGADAGARVDKTSSGSRESSEGTTAADVATGTRGTTADPSDLSAPAAGPRSGVATKGEEVGRHRGDPSTSRATRAVAPDPSPAGAPKKRAKKYPLDPKQCLHTVGIDLDGRCTDCGEQLSEVSA